MISSKENKNSFLLLLVPLLMIGMILQIVQLPEIVSQNRPDFLMLFILFFAVQSRKFTYTLEISWVVGLLLDLTTGASLGINALIISSQIYLITTQFKNFHKYVMFQQMIIVGIVNFLVCILGYWIEHIIGQAYFEMQFLIPAVSTALFWPFIYIICAILCSTFSIEIYDKEKAD